MTYYLIIDGGRDIHAVASTLEQAKKWVEQAMIKYRGSTYRIEEIQFIG